MDGRPGPIHSCLPVLSNSPELPACLTARPRRVLTTGHTLRAEGRVRARSSGPQLSYQKGLRIAYTFHLWKSFPVLSPGFRNPGFPVRQDIGHIQCRMEIVDLLQRTHSIRGAAHTQCLGPWRQAGSGSGGPTERERRGSQGGASSPGPTPGVKRFPLGPKSGHFQGMAASAGAPQWGPVWPSGAPHTRRRCHRALGRVELLWAAQA